MSKLDAALALIARGLPVIAVYPVGPDGQTCHCPQGRACRSAGKHPRGPNWQHRPMRTEAEVRAHWEAHPKDNVGIPTGATSGVFVLDVDGEQGKASYAALREQHGPQPATLLANTGGGGKHLLYRMPEGETIPNSSSKIAPGLDIRGDGGFIVAAGSVSSKGAYSWANDLPIVDPSAELLGLARATSSPASSAGERGDPDAHNVGPKFTELPEAEQVRIRGWLESAERSEAASLAKAATWPEKRTNDRGNGWEKITADLCARFGALALAPWSPWTMQDAEAAVRRAVPPAIAAMVPLDTKWSTQRHRGVPAKFPEPRATLADLVPAQTAPSGGSPVAARSDPNQLWDARPELSTIREFARARRCAPLAVLGIALAHVAAAVPAFVQLPPLIGGPGSLNIFVVLAGASGGGKGAAERCASEAVQLTGGVSFASLGVGSGEGIAHMFVRRTKDGIEQHTQSVLFSVPEVDTLAALKGRQGSTLLPELRKAWSGEGLGFAYSDPTKRLEVRRGTYRLCAVVGVQPTRAAALLDDEDAGTPQRFVWSSVVDPDAPDVAPPAPEPVLWHMPKRWPPPRQGGTYLPVCDEARVAVDQARLQQLRTGTSDLDAHALQARLKTAAALALLNGRVDVGSEDWWLAGLLMAASDECRASVQRTLAAAAEKANTGRALSEGRRLVVQGEVVADDELKRACGAIRRKLVREGGWVAGNVARRAVAGKLRHHYEDALDSLVQSGVVEVEADSGRAGQRIRTAVDA